MPDIDAAQRVTIVEEILHEGGPRRGTAACGAAPIARP